MQPKNRLLLVVNIFTPDQCGGAVLFEDLAQGLTERGFEVTVRTAFPYYPEWEDKSGKNGWRIEKHEGVFRLERYGLYIPQNPKSLVARLLYEASFFFSLLRSLFRGRFDVVMVVCPLMGAVAFGACMKWFRGAPLWLNVQDISADAASASGISKSGSFQKVLERVQNFFFNRADIWSSVSPVMVQRLSELQTKQQPIFYLPNWLHQSIANALASLPPKLPRDLSKPLKLFYSGNIGTKQGLLDLIQSLAASKADFHFQINGSGAEANTIQQWIESSQDTRFSFGNLLPESAYLHTLHEADFFVITEKAGSGGSFIPSKMIPSIAVGTPILAISDVESPFGQEMNFSEAGKHFTWAEVENIPEWLAETANTPEQHDIWRQNALQRAAFYQRDTILNQYAEELRKLIIDN